MTDAKLILYHTDDGQAELFDTTKQNVSLHIKNILQEGELEEAATVKESLTVQAEGNRQVRRKTLLYNLHMIWATGCAPPVAPSSASGPPGTLPKFGQGFRHG